MARIDLDHIRHAYTDNPKSDADFALKEVHHTFDEGGAYALLGGRTGRVMSAKRIRLASQLSGLFLIGGGVWLAFTRAR